MKRFFLIALCAVAVTLSAQEQLPQWAVNLITLNPGVIDSILYYPADPQGPNTRTYVVYYNQPLNHSQAGSAHFPLRALITVYKNGDPTKAVNHVYASGYNIMTGYIMRPDSIFGSDTKDCAFEIAHRYNANHIQIEHRYFQQSAPAQCWTTLDDLRAEEAAADFHYFFEALKKVLKGKYVMSGVSKGGITTLLQHRFYPNDMDIFVPYSAPFFDTDRDTVMHRYWYNNGWNEEYRTMFMNVRKAGFDRQDNIFPAFLKMRGGAKTTAARDSAYCFYLHAIAEFGYDEHTYSDTASIRKMMHTNDSIMQAKGVQAYGDTVYAYMFDKGTYNLASFPAWLDTIRKYPDNNQAPLVKNQHRQTRPFGITYEQWWGRDTVSGEAYYYQAKRELGYFDYRFDLILDDPTKAAYYNNLWKQKADCSLSLQTYYFNSLTFSPSLYNETMSATQAATKPIVLIYGFDDTWTGAAVKDQFINGTNVRKFILPAQNHLVNFTSNTDPAMCNDICAILDGVLGSPQGLEEVSGQSSAPQAVKIFRDGQVLILRGDKTYTLTGQVVK